MRRKFPGTRRPGPAARLLVSTDAGRKVLQSEPSIFDRTGVPGLARVYLPAREVLGVTRAKVLGLDPATKFNDLRSFDLPAAAGPDPTTVSVTLLLCGLEQKLERISGELFRFFTPLVGEERALRIARVGLVIDPSRAVPSYLDGNIRLPATLDLTRDECCETLMHEWTHHAMAVLANDPDVEGRLGGAHQTWEAAPNRKLAWDEARAHFFSVDPAREASPEPTAPALRPDVERDDAPPAAAGTSVLEAAQARRDRAFRAYTRLVTSNEQGDVDAAPAEYKAAVDAVGLALVIDEASGAELSQGQESRPLQVGLPTFVPGAPGTKAISGNRGKLYPDRNPSVAK